MGIGVRHIFDWADRCPDDVGARAFPPIVGGGRGHEPFQCIRCGFESWEKPCAHRPLNSGIRTCGGKMVPRSQVTEARREADKNFLLAVHRMASAERGGPSVSGFGVGLWQFLT